ncbi:MlaD family protein [Curvibacter gracilis]|uniref:MlaD family protein n=1 Tax=Curvibacter gracilis TaxID=230310 RepID=UPI0012FC86CC|nr:MlaD family protein [Curvibacter gracilis]
MPTFEDTQAPQPLDQAHAGRLWIVLSLVSAIVLTGVGAWRQGWFTPKVVLLVQLPGANGVQVGMPVKLKGFKIGEVNAIELSPELNVTAHLQIDAQRLNLLTEGTRARLTRESPIGGRFIDIVVGPQDRPLLADGGTLPMDNGNDLDDMMVSVRVAVEKLTQAIGKVDPILDDTHKITTEANAVSGQVRESLTAMLVNFQAISAQLNTISKTSSGLIAHADQDRATLATDARHTLQATTQLMQSANTALLAVQKELPQLLGKVQDTMADIQTVTADVKQISTAARHQLPAAMRAGRASLDDVAEITDGARRTWPLSSMVNTASPVPLPLDGFEDGTAPPTRTSSP